MKETFENSMDSEVKPVHFNRNSDKLFFEGKLFEIKLNYFGQIFEIHDSLEKDTMLGKTEVERRLGRPRTRLLVGVTEALHMTLVRSSRYRARQTGMEFFIQEVTESRKRLND